MFLEATTFDVTSALETGKIVVTWVLGLVTEQPILSACFVLGTIVPCGIYAFNRFKGASK